MEMKKPDADTADSRRSEGWQEKWLDRYYRSKPDWVDGTQEFHQFCLERIPSNAIVLEIGAGPQNQTTEFLSSRWSLVGLDPDPAVLGNGFLREAKVLETKDFPFESGSFDAVVSNYVLEHVQYPGQHLFEVSRVLRPGGCYVFRTPNLFHYVSAAAWITPHWVHGLFANRLRNLSEHGQEPYPTFHRLNTTRAVRREAARAGLEVLDLRLIEKEPSYGLSARTLFLTFMLYERIVNSTRFFSSLRTNILGALRKAT
jgi:SAM-dependent methyltransferase